MNREISTPVDSELNNDALITEIWEIRKEAHTFAEKNINSLREDC